ncbi:MAG: hypothetical protein LBS06_06680 [Treponema sp.]|nr:hypothetical protein [Treponema sp.]
MRPGTISANTFPSIGYAINASRGGRMSLPVSPSAYIYSHFKHVSGVPAPEGVRGVAINRLKILDTLIEQLARLKKQPEPSWGAAGETSEERLDALIEQYEHQIRTVRAVSAQTAGAALPYSLAASASPAPLGAVFSLSA